MKALITEIFRTIKIKLLEFKYRHEVNAKTGLSLAERKRLKSVPRFTTENASFFGKNFLFSDSGSFLHSVDEIFLDEIYKFKTEKKSPYIIDCGSNIGLSLYYFKKLLPDSNILAFEPDKKIFSILEKNIKNLGFSNVEIKEEGVWIEDGTLEFFSEGALAGSSVVDLAQKKNKTVIKTTDLNKYLNKPVDFLKIDIEGAENQLLFHIKDHLHYVENFFLEYHGLSGEEQNLAEILNLLKEVGFKYYIRLAGEAVKFPFLKETPKGFNQQLNIFCFRAENF